MALTDPNNGVNETPTGMKALSAGGFPGAGSGKSLAPILTVLTALGALQEAAGMPMGVPPLGWDDPRFPEGFLPKRCYRGLFSGETFEVTDVHEQNPEDDNRRAVVTIQIKQGGAVVKTYTGAVLQKLTTTSPAGLTAVAWRFLYNGEPVFITCDCHVSDDWKAALEKCSVTGTLSTTGTKMLWFLNDSLELSEVAGTPVEGTDGEYYLPAVGEYATIGDDLFETEFEASQVAVLLLQEFIADASQGIAHFASRCGQIDVAEKAAPRIENLLSGFLTLKNSPNLVTLKQARMFTAVKLLQDKRITELTAQG